MNRKSIKRIRDIPNIGKAVERDLSLLGITSPAGLIGKDPFRMYDELCAISGKKHDPCLIDVFISAVRFMEGAPPRKWWEYTDERKRILAQR